MLASAEGDPNLLRLVQRPLLLYGDGKQTRDFTYVDDAVQGLLAKLDLAVQDVATFVYPCFFKAEHRKIGKRLGLTGWLMMALTRSSSGTPGRGGIGCSTPSPSRQLPVASSSAMTMTKS